MPNVNKIRGKYFEQKIVNSYREALQLSKLECYRSGSSGARTSLEITGDISFSNPIKYQIITECKYRLTLNIDNIFPTLNSECDSFIEQNARQETLFQQEIPEGQISENGIVSVIIIGRPHQKDENYYTLIMQPGNMNFDNDCRIYTYSKYLDEKIMVVPFKTYIDKISAMYAKNN